MEPTTETPGGDSAADTQQQIDQAIAAADAAAPKKATTRKRAPRRATSSGAAADAAVTAPAEALVVFGPVVVSPGLATHSHTGSPTASRVSVSFGVEAISGAFSPIWETAVCASSAGST